MTTRNSGSSRSSGGGADSKRYSSSNVSPTPRWKQTPPQMKAPIQMDFAKNPLNKLWKVNSDPAKLDAAYDRLLGPGGSRLLPEELKWLAVTHKSFDQGRRGFNDKLALTGRMALVMEVTKDVVSRPPLGPAAAAAAPATDEFGREPFAHPQLRSVDNLFFRTPLHVVGKDKLSLLAERVGLSEVIRWKPRKVRFSVVLKLPLLPFFFFHVCCEESTRGFFTYRMTRGSVLTWGMRIAREPRRFGHRRGAHGGHVRHHRRHHAAARAGGGEQGAEGEDTARAAVGGQIGTSSRLLG